MCPKLASSTVPEHDSIFFRDLRYLEILIKSCKKCNKCQHLIPRITIADPDPQGSELIGWIRVQIINSIPDSDLTLGFYRKLSSEVKKTQ